MKWESLRELCTTKDKFSLMWELDWLRLPRLAWNDFQKIFEIHLLFYFIQFSELSPAALITYQKLVGHTQSSWSAESQPNWSCISTGILCHQRCHGGQPPQGLVSATQDPWHLPVSGAGKGDQGGPEAPQVALVAPVELLCFLCILISESGSSPVSSCCPDEHSPKHTWSLPQKGRVLELLCQAKQIIG